MLSVVCVKAKPHYNAEYVNHLYRSVERHLTVPHRFYCFTDDDGGLKCQTKRLPKMPQVRGWWAKLALHRPEVLSGKVLYLDLDTLVVRNIDFLASLTCDFAILEDFYRPSGYGSGVMLWNKPQPQLWRDWIEAGSPDDVLGDQGWVEKKVPNAVRLQREFPGKIVSYKAHCAGGLPGDAAIVCFHGIPKPHQLGPGDWAFKLWRGAHVEKLIALQRERMARHALAEPRAAA